MDYAFCILWRDRYRFMPAVFATAFSAVLIAVQCGLVLGLLMCTSVPIDDSSADIWVMTPGATSLQQTYPIPEYWQLRVARQPEVVRTEPYLVGSGAWHTPGLGSSELCFIVGMRLDDGSLGALRQFPPEVRRQLMEPGTVVVDDWDKDSLGIHDGAGEVAEINGQRVRVVGTVHGFHGHNFAYVFCSLQTAQQLLPQFDLNDGTTMCILARCNDPKKADAVVERMRAEYPDMGIYTKQDLSRRARIYWLIRSTGGTVMICTIVLALLVGLVVTRQTLYAAILASLREYAVLVALGIPRWRLVYLVLSKSFLIGVGGVLAALPVIVLLSESAVLIQTRVLLPFYLLVATVILTMGMALLSGLTALRSLHQVEPAILLR